MQGQETESLRKDEEGQNETITIPHLYSVLVHYLICTNLFQARARVGLGDKKSEDYETPTNQSR